MFKALQEELRNNGYDLEMLGSGEIRRIRISTLDGRDLTGADYQWITNALEFYVPTWSDQMSQYEMVTAPSFQFEIY